MARITVTIDTDNAAFGPDTEGEAQEVAIVINRLSHRVLETGAIFEVPEAILDTNGNRVGSFLVREN